MLHAHTRDTCAIVGRQNNPTQSLLRPIPQDAHGSAGGHLLRLAIPDLVSVAELIVRVTTGIATSPLVRTRSAVSHPEPPIHQPQSCVGAERQVAIRFG